MSHGVRVTSRGIPWGFHNYQRDVVVCSTGIPRYPADKVIHPVVLTQRYGCVLVWCKSSVSITLVSSPTTTEDIHTTVIRTNEMDKNNMHPPTFTHYKQHVWLYVLCLIAIFPRNIAVELTSTGTSPFVGFVSYCNNIVRYFLWNCGGETRQLNRTT